MPPPLTKGNGSFWKVANPAELQFAAKERRMPPDIPKPISDTHLNYELLPAVYTY
jgi:hypothetical protein